MMNNLNIYNNISRARIEGSYKNNTISSLELLLKTDPSIAKKIIKALIAFKYYRKQNDTNKQLEALNKLDDLTKDILILGRLELMELVKNRSYFIQRNIPKTFMNFLNKLKNNDNAIFESVTKEHIEFLKSSGVNCEKDILNDAFIKKTTDDNDISCSDFNLRNLLEQEEIKDKINKTLCSIVEGRLPNVTVQKIDDCFEIIFKRGTQKTILVIDSDPITCVSAEEMYSSIQKNALNVCAIKRGNKWVIQDNNAMLEWFKKGAKDPLTKENIIFSGKRCNFISGKNLLKFLFVLRFGNS